LAVKHTIIPATNKTWRLALAAAKVVYGEDLVAYGPAYQSMTIEGAQIRIGFSNVGSSLSIKGGDSLLASSEAIRRPVSVRYDWRNMPDGNLYNREGLPAIPFRADAPNSPSWKR